MTIEEKTADLLRYLKEYKQFENISINSGIKVEEITLNLRQSHHKSITSTSVEIESERDYYNVIQYLKKELNFKYYTFKVEPYDCNKKYLYFYN